MRALAASLRSVTGPITRGVERREMKSKERIKALQKNTLDGLGKKIERGIQCLGLELVAEMAGKARNDILPVANKDKNVDHLRSQFYHATERNVRQNHECICFSNGLVRLI
jgi:hypothetical protein